MTKRVTITRPDDQLEVVVPAEMVDLLVAICASYGWEIQVEDAD